MKKTKAYKKITLMSACIMLAFSACSTKPNNKTASNAENGAEADDGENSTPINFGIRIAEAKSEGYTLSVLCEASYPEAEKLGDGFCFDKININLPENMKINYSEESYIEDIDGDTVKIRTDFIFQEKIPNGRYELEFTDFGYQKDGKFMLLADGIWSKSCVIGEGNKGIRLDLNNTFIDIPAKEGSKAYQFNLKSCEIGKNSMSINYGSESGSANISKVFIKFKDGTALEVSKTTDKTGFYSKDTGEGSLVINFSDEIDVDEIESISIYGKEFNVDK